MVGGDKRLPSAVPGSADGWRARLLALALIAACAVLVAWIIGLGAMPAA